MVSVIRFQLEHAVVIIIFSIRRGEGSEDFKLLSDENDVTLPGNGNEIS